VFGIGHFSIFFVKQFYCLVIKPKES